MPEALRQHPNVEYRSLSQDGVLCHNHPDNACVFEFDPSNPITVILTGDSHADSLSNDLFLKLSNAGIGRYVHSTVSGCPILLGFSIEGNKFCTQQRHKERLELIEAFSTKGPTVSIYFARTPVQLSGVRYNGGPGRVEEGPAFRHVVDGNRAENLVQTLNLIASKSSLLVVYPMPELGIHAQRYFLEKIIPIVSAKLDRIMEEAPLGIPEDMFRARAADSFAALDRVAVPKSQRIYPHELICGTVREGWCTAHENGMLYYTDSNHPNWLLADQINSRIIEAVFRIFNAKDRASED